jgi:hypothetical protein
MNSLIIEKQGITGNFHPPHKTMAMPPLNDFTI